MRADPAHTENKKGKLCRSVDSLQSFPFYFISMYRFIPLHFIEPRNPSPGSYSLIVQPNESSSEPFWMPVKVS